LRAKTTEENVFTEIEIEIERWRFEVWGKWFKV